jgi:hypothetical protein
MRLFHLGQCCSADEDYRGDAGVMNAWLRSRGSLPRPSSSFFSVSRLNQPYAYEYDPLYTCEEVRAKLSMNAFVELTNGAMYWTLIRKVCLVLSKTFLCAKIGRNFQIALPPMLAYEYLKL